CQVFGGRQTGGILVPFELDVTAERDPGEAPPCAAPVVETGYLRPKTDRERLNGYAERARGEEMPELMDNHNHAEHEQERDGPPEKPSGHRGDRLRYHGEQPSGTAAVSGKGGSLKHVPLRKDTGKLWGRLVIASTARSAGCGVNCCR